MEPEQAATESPVLPPKVPGGHGWGAEEPPAQKAPRGHCTTAPPLQKEPAAAEQGAGLEEGEGEKLGQYGAEARREEDATQAAAEPEPAVAVVVPAGQAVGRAEPAGQKLPAGQGQAEPEAQRKL